MRNNVHQHARFLVVLALLLASNVLVSQDIKVEVPNAFCYDGLNPLPISDFVEIQGDGAEILLGMQVIISGGYDETHDVITFTDGDGINGSFDEFEGIMTLSGEANLDAYRNALERTFFTTTAARENASRSITTSLSNLDFLPQNGHFYQYFPQMSILWNAAKDSAANKTLFGLTGYLATITSEAESNFIIERVAGSAWIGATDQLNEGTWRWVTGPEGMENGGDGRIINSFINWNDGEPNNCCGGEDFAHMMDWTSPPGRWNDLSATSAPVGSPFHPTGYMVEYGGLPGDPDVVNNITGVTILEMEPEVNITGSVSVCPNITGLTYETIDLAGYTYEWTVSGGTIVSGTGTHQITVNWGNTNATASVTVRAFSGVACDITTSLNVIINEQLEPPLPLGPSDVCFTDLSTPQTYSTPVTSGSDYQWIVTGGSIVGLNGTNEIQVLWDGPGLGTLYFTESTSTATDVCDGNSPTLEIILRQETQPQFQINAASCFGGSDGSISLADYMGETPYTLTWNTGGTGTPETERITGLSAGRYSVDIEAAGCTVNFPFTIAEPIELTGTVAVIDARCFGEASGIAMANVVGGTGAYRYVWSTGTSGTDNTLTDLAMGDYSVDVLDQNDCVLTLNFSIEEPEELLINEIVSTLITCPEGSDGTLEAFVVGGVEPYTYSWEGSSDLTALATGFSKGIYQLNVTDANGCVITGSQEVEEDTPKIYLPTAFSPNNDGANETFGPSTSCPFNFRMTIYNQWGTPVFSTNAVNNRWDGTYQGKEAPIGKYTYAASWNITVNNRLISEERSGVIRLIR
jgi:gliding motility-associated-like protein